MIPLPKVEGTLAEHDFPELVRALHANRWSGLLTLTYSGIGKSVTVQSGQLVFGSSTSADDRLGELLLRRGRIPLKQYVEAGRRIAPGKRMGAILVELGALTPKDLVQCVVEHTQEIIYSLFQWTEGRYRLQAGSDSAHETITLKMNTLDLITEGIHRIDSWLRIDRAVGGLETRYVRRSDYESVLSEMSLSFEKLALLTGLHGVQSVEQICAESSLPDFEVCRCLWAFRVIGVVDRVDTPPATAAAVEDEGLAALLAKE